MKIAKRIMEGMPNGMGLPERACRHTKDVCRQKGGRPILRDSANGEVVLTGSEK